MTIKTLMFIKEYSKKQYHGFHKYEAVNNNHKCFLSIKSAYKNDFCFEGSCDTEDCSNDAENSALITEINYIIKCSNILQSWWAVLLLYYFKDENIYCNKQQYLPRYLFPKTF